MVLDLHLFALGLYAFATALALAPFTALSRPPRALLLAVPIAGAAFHVAAVSQITLVGVAPVLSVFALFLILFQIASERFYHASAVAVFTAPLATGFVGLALLLGLSPDAQPSAGGRGAWFVFHVTLSVLGVALLALAFIAAALYLWQFRALKTKRFGQVFAYLPSLAQLDRLNRMALVAGFPALTLGVLLAIGYSVRFESGMAVDNAQVVWGLFTWAVVGWAVWVRIGRQWAGRRAAVASIAGFAAVVLVYLALKLTVPGAARFL
ncbi:MAG TPA: cytochrome c biogenesis protein CcsA [Gemmatimonadales bacterium]|nr:cytochrome c biogenesis protein CcsA [Gemmatimonadales bacterium]